MNRTECRGRQGGCSEVRVRFQREAGHHHEDDHLTNYEEELMNVGSGVGSD